MIQIYKFKKGSEKPTFNSLSSFSPGKAYNFGYEAYAYLKIFDGGNP
jgi:hypothetical protein